MSVNNNNKEFNEDPLPKFESWLKQQIDSGNQQFSLNRQDLIRYNPSDNPYLIFLLPEVFEQYHQHTGNAADIIQSVLKNSLGITFAYTIVKDEEITEVFPCEKFF